MICGRLSASKKSGISAAGECSGVLSASIEISSIILEEKHLGKAKALQLGDRLGFIENQIFGRAGKQSIPALGEFVYSSGGDHLPNEIESILRSLKDMIEFGAE